MPGRSYSEEYQINLPYRLKYNVICMKCKEQFNRIIESLYPIDKKKYKGRQPGVCQTCEARYRNKMGGSMDQFTTVKF